MKNKTLLYIFILLSFVACTSSRKMRMFSTKVNNLNDAYAIHPQFEIFHVNETLSELHFKINSNELLYTRSDGSNLTTNVLIKYTLVSKKNPGEIIDSASQKLVDINNSSEMKYLIGKINIHSNTSVNYILNINIIDANRNVSKLSTFEFENGNDLNRQNFLVTSVKTGVPLFRNYVKINEAVSIIHKKKASAEVYVRYYHRGFPLASPIFSTTNSTTSESFKFKEDSLFVLKIDENGIINFSAFDNGIYHFQCDSSSRIGFTLFVFSTNFPLITAVEDMIPPIRYITTFDEFTTIEQSNNKRKSIEGFWLKSSSNFERARDLISDYYTRVEEANYLFSSYISI